MVFVIDSTALRPSPSAVVAAVLRTLSYLGSSAGLEWGFKFFSSRSPPAPSMTKLQFQRPDRAGIEGFVPRKPPALPPYHSVLITVVVSDNPRRHARVMDVASDRYKEISVRPPLMIL